MSYDRSYRNALGGILMHEGSSNQYQELFEELSEYEQSGIQINMDGRPASPLQIVNAHMVREESTYMRDYVLDDDGHLKELSFHNLEKMDRR